MASLPSQHKKWQEGYTLYTNGAPATTCTTAAQSAGYGSARRGHLAAALVENFMSAGGTAESADHELARLAENGAYL